MYGPKGKGRITDFSDHPRNPSRIEKGRHAGNVSTAAGRYQITAPTWDEYAKKLNLPDFSPPNQDKAAWAIAKDRYRRATGGGSLDDALTSGGGSTIKAAGRLLGGTWTSLPGGSQQRLTEREYFDNYSMNRQAREGRMPVPQARPATFEERVGNGIEDPSQEPLASALMERIERMRRNVPPGPASDAQRFWDGLVRDRGSLKDVSRDWLE